jgi:hypothetical protein
MSQGHQCINCQNYRMQVKCLAYPVKIPQDIFDGSFDHSKPFPNSKNPTDKGIMFKELKL